ncbi:MAG: alpha/beta superfamily hydrolase [Ilumatobacteraceae bacterium]|nr:alpha/beta superfamily hydrolase [Ilumatobacteraceae bacterium]
MTTSPHRRIRFWLETSHGALAATWFRSRPDQSCRAAIVVVGGIAHEERTMSTGLAAIAEQFADAGMPTLLFDLQGTAQSTADLDTPGVAARWPDDVRTAVRHARDQGFDQIVLIGVRIGALITSAAFADDTIDAVDAAVLWSPVASGRRYGRELRLMQNVSNVALGETSVGSARDAGDAPTAIEIGGFAIPDDVVRGLRSFDIGRTERPPAPAVLVIDAPEKDHDDTVAHLRAIGARVDQHVGPETDAWLNRTTDGSSIPRNDILEVVRWVRRSISARTVDAPEFDPKHFPAVRTVDHRGTLIRETLVTIGDAALSGVWCEPLPGAARRSGPARIVAPAVGPGRCFVEFMRTQATLGYCSLRLDLSGFGTSPRRPGRETWSGYYSHDGSVDYNTAIDFVLARHDPEVVLLGFCATAWSAIQAGPRPEIVGIAALNLHLHVRDRRASIFNNDDLTWLEQIVDRRLDRNRRTRLYHAVYRRSRLLPSTPIRWVTELLRRGTRIIFLYDVGHEIEYLDRRMPTSWHARLSTGQMRIRTYAMLGHALEGPRDRDRALADLVSELAELDRPASSPAGAAIRPQR